MGAWQSPSFCLCYTPPMHAQTWPDPLTPPDAQRVQALLDAFWGNLELLAGLLEGGELLLAEECIASLRASVVEMMLALNGIQRPDGTRRLNAYLGASQRHALERTLSAAGTGAEAAVARAVALTVIYRWYAPQLVAAFGLDYPDASERAAWQTLTQSVPAWPLAVTTE